MLDLAQLGLSVAGIFDPTPTCDAIDGLISLLRGDYVGAGISAVSMIPYIGDAAKLGKLGKAAGIISQVDDLSSAAGKYARKSFGDGVDRAEVRTDFAKQGQSREVLENNSSWGGYNEADLRQFLASTLPGVPIAEQIKIMPFRANRIPAGFNFIPDFVAHLANYDIHVLLDAKLTSAAQYTKRQVPGYALYQQFGGVVVQSRDPRYPVGMELGPAPTLRAEPTADPRDPIARPAGASSNFVLAPMKFELRNGQWRVVNRTG